MIGIDSVISMSLPVCYTKDLLSKTVVMAFGCRTAGAGMSNMQGMAI